jgi:hypothetical protein
MSEHTDKQLIPSIPTFTIMPDFVGAYGWVSRREEGDHGVGSCHADDSGWYATPGISAPLQQSFAEWQAVFNRTRGDFTHDFDWEEFHRRGLALAVLLKIELGNAARIVYEKPFEDPSCDADERREVRIDGSIRKLPSRRELGLKQSPQE